MRLRKIITMGKGELWKTIGDIMDILSLAPDDIKGVYDRARSYFTAAEYKREIERYPVIPEYEFDNGF